jgi:hypothetical protein
MTVLPPSFRTRATEARYQEDKRLGRTRPLQDEPAIKDFRYFRIIHNRYEYDDMFDPETCDMLVIKRKVARKSEFTLAELHELTEIEEGYVNRHYEHILKNTEKSMSLPDLWHCHLVNKKGKADARNKV